MFARYVPHTLATHAYVYGVTDTDCWHNMAALTEVSRLSDVDFTEKTGREIKRNTAAFIKKEVFVPILIDVTHKGASVPSLFNLPGIRLFILLCVCLFIRYD